MDTSPICLDLESAPDANARLWIDPPDLTDIQAPSNYVKPEAIAGYIEKEKAKRLADYETNCTSKAALDFNLARVVALGWWTETAAEYYPLPGEEVEAEAIAMFWRKAEHRTIVGFRIREFDLPMLIQRSRYLGIRYPHLDLGRYARGSSIVDLSDVLTFNDQRSAEQIMRRTLKAFARRFGIPVNDTINGKDIPALVAAGDWEAIVSHVQADVETTVELARRLGVIQRQHAMVSGF